MYIYNMLLKMPLTNPFSVEDMAKLRRINPASARVLCSRYAQKEYILRLKNNLYITGADWENLSWEERLQLANRIQVPSYISLLTALAYYELTTQVPVSRIESIARTKSYFKEIKDVEFSYTKIAGNLYSGFTRRNGLFIATPEKALADCIYFSSLGKYALDLNALDWGSLDQSAFRKELKHFPEKTLNWWQNYGRV